MAAHNGKVTVRSVEGAGSTFTLFIPLRGEHASTGAA
jgi:signal transduction histidine kinase